MKTNRIHWESVDPATFEDLASVLVSRLHPDVVRVDGAGGDDARDAYFSTPAGLEVFEMKSFTGRVDRSRRRQVEGSLSRTAKHGPLTWSVVSPIDLTPSEQTWFESIAAKHNFKCVWLGRTWLDSQLALRPDITRYFLSGAADEVVTLLKELKQEEAALAGGLPDAIKRMNSLANRLSEMDPYYEFQITAGTSGQHVSVKPRYAGAERDRPIKLGGRFTFPNSEQGRSAAAALQETVEYGSSSVIRSEYVAEVSVDGPAGLDKLLTGGEIHLSAIEQTPHETLDISLRLHRADGALFTSLPLRQSTFTHGTRGLLFKLTDHSGLLRVELRLDIPAQRIHLRYWYESELELPGTMLPALKFLCAMEPGMTTTIRLNGVDACPPTEVGRNSHDELRGLLRIVEDLDTLQRHTGTYFALPADVEADESVLLHRLATLVREGEVTDHWEREELTLGAESLAAMKEAGMSEKQAGSIFLNLDLDVSLNGHELRLGRCSRVLHSARMAREPTKHGDDFRVALVPGSDDTVTTTLLNPNQSE